MGKSFFDQFSLLHFASGVVAYFWGVPFNVWFYAHAVFELLENTSNGMRIINNYITLWPGGKNSPDSFINMVGDQVFAMLGFLVASNLDKLYKMTN